MLEKNDKLYTYQEYCLLYSIAKKNLGMNQVIFFWNREYITAYNKDREEWDTSLETKERLGNCLWRFDE